MRRILISLTVIALLFIPQVALSSDLDDFKAADELGEKLNFSLDLKDLEAYTNMFDEDFVVFQPDIPFPIKATKDRIKQTKAADIEKLEYINWIPGNTIYRVVGDTGIVSKFGTAITKLKGAPEVVNNIRYTIVYAKIKGKWLVCAAHISRIPLGK
jgi:ketosteroid isomerase-like protein